MDPENTEHVGAIPLPIFIEAAMPVINAALLVDKDGYSFLDDLHDAVEQFMGVLAQYENKELAQYENKEEKGIRWLDD